MENKNNSTATNNKPETLSWEKVWLYSGETRENIKSRAERAALLIQYVHTGQMPNRATFFSFPISFADLATVRAGKVSADSVHALAMRLFDSKTGSQVCDPTAVIQAMDMWEKDRRLPEGMSFHRHEIDLSGAQEASTKSAPLRGDQLKRELSDKFRQK